MPDDDLDSMFEGTLASQPIPSPETKAPNPLFRKPDERDLWRSDGLRFIFIRVHCTTCGSVSAIPDGVFVHSTHARNHCTHLERTHISAASFPNLPRSVQYLDGHSPFCQNCLEVN